MTKTLKTKTTKATNLKAGSLKGKTLKGIKNLNDIVKEVKKVKETTKTDSVLDWVEAGKTRKYIIDELCKMTPDSTRKSQAGLVSHIFKKHDLLGKVPSGVERVEKKEVKVIAKKKITKKEK